MGNIIANLIRFPAITNGIEMAESLRELNMSLRDDYSAITPENIRITMNTYVTVQNYEICQSRYKIRMMITPLDWRKTNITVELQPEAGKENENFLVTLHFYFSESDLLGHYFDMAYGTTVFEGARIVIGQATVDRLHGRKIIMNAFSPRIESENGEVYRKMGPLSLLERKSWSSYSRTLRGPTFYTSPDGYRVKLDLEYRGGFVAKITFLSGRNDKDLSGNFCHLTNVVLLERPIGRTKAKYLVKTSMQELALNKSYTYRLGFRSSLEFGGFIKDDYMFISVSIKPMDGVIIGGVNAVSGTIAEAQRYI